MAVIRHPSCRCSIPCMGVYISSERASSKPFFIFSQLDALVAEKLNTGSFLALKNLEILFAYDMELNCLRIRATNQKHILIILPGEKVGDRMTRRAEGRTPQKP